MAQQKGKPLDQYFSRKGRQRTRTEAEALRWKHIDELRDAFKARNAAHMWLSQYFKRIELAKKYTEFAKVQFDDSLDNEAKVTFMALLIAQIAQRTGRSNEDVLEEYNELIRSLGLMNTRMALILPNLAVGFHIIIMRNFLMTIDDAYEEAAIIDGANYIQVLWRIIIPLSKPVIATIALWTAVFHWNEWFQALIYITSDNKIILQRILRKLIHELEMIMREDMAAFAELEQIEMPTSAVQAAVTLLTIGPIIFVYPFLQRYFVKGIFIGSLKG